MGMATPPPDAPPSDEQEVEYVDDPDLVNRIF